jgi:hypothetical protein
MPNLAFVGDIHGGVLKMYAALVDWMYRTGTKIDAVVQVGDLGVYPGTEWGTIYRHKTSCPIPTWAIMGNHEDPAMIREWRASPNRIPDMHLIEDGTIVDVCGVKVGGIWGNYSPRSWVEPHNVLYHRNGGSSPRTAMHICQQSVRSLLSQRQSKMDVLVTHDTARCTLPLKFAGQPMDPEIKEILGLRQSEESNGCPAFDEILDVFKPAYYFFGHLHHYAEGWHGPTKTTCLDALGYSENWCKVVTIGEQENDSLFGGELDKAA